MIKAKDNAMTYRYEKCLVCKKKWNISTLRDTSKGYICPVCAYKGRGKDGEKKTDQGAGDP